MEKVGKVYVVRAEDSRGPEVLKWDMQDSVKEAVAVGPAGYGAPLRCLPRHRMHKRRGFKTHWMTWRAIIGCPWVAAAREFLGDPEASATYWQCPPVVGCCWLTPG